MKRFSILFFSLLIILSCRNEDNPKAQFLKWAKTGAITENVACKNDPSQSYCVYLPKNYDPSKKYPTIYAFDPHGKGRIPVALMKNITEKLGYIAVGSNNSRNGLKLEEIYRTVNTLFTDTKLKLAIDTNRIYLLGFSGGARIACMIAQENISIKGVIACSAGFQPQKNPLGFRFIGIAGSQDMNYLEMKQLSSLLDSIHTPNQFIVFRGKHQWPYESIVSEAITMLDINAMRDSIVPANRKTIDEYYSKALIRIKSLLNSNSTDSLALAYSASKRAIETLSNLTNTESLKSIYDELEQSQKNQKYLKDQLYSERYELQKQKEFMAAFGLKSEEWWNNEIKALNGNSNGLKGDVSIRLLGYISLSCYSYVNGALRHQDWKAAKYFTSIYRQVDPENPDSWYALACYQANNGKSSDAVKSLQSAIKFGLSDFSKIKNDPLLYKLRGLEEYNALFNKKKH